MCLKSYHLDIKSMNTRSEMCYNNKMSQIMRNTSMISPLENLYDCMVTGTLGIMSATAEHLISKLGLTDDEKEILKKYSNKLFWCTILEQYIESKIALNFKEKSFLKRAVVETKDVDLAIKLSKFLDSTNKDEAKKLRDDIYNGIPKDILKDFCNLAHKFSK